MNAITDAIGTEELSMPATPSNVWQAIQANTTLKAAAGSEDVFNNISHRHFR